MRAFRQVPDHASFPAVLLCADDFAMSPGTSAVIAGLAQKRSINAISCMAAASGWPVDSRLLAPLEAEGSAPAERVQIGLHLVLASEVPLSAMSCQDAEGRLPGPDHILMLGLRRRLPLDEFAAEIDRQFIAFAGAMGRMPDFVDAHQHVHVVPGLRELVISATLRHAPHAWVRVPSDGLAAMLKRPFPGKAVGSAIQTLGFAGALRRSGLAANSSFAGHYDFGDRFAEHLPHFFAGRSSRHLIMCHPGADDLPGDAIGKARRVEAEVLGGMTLSERIARAGTGGGHG